MTVTRRRPTRRIALLALGATFCVAATPAAADSAAEIERDSRAALNRLYASHPKAQAIGAKARSVIVFPKIVKAGAMVGAQRGEGAMFRGGRVAGFYRISAASFGFQLGGQTFGYAIFLMNDDALAELNKTDGWAVGASPSLVVADEGFMKTTNTSTLAKNVYAVPFSQKGLMAGSGLEGSKITKITPKK